MSLIASHAAESGHWYGRNGEPAYTIVGANGKARPTTLRDARKLNLVPSVTTIIKVASQPGLDRWKQEQVLLAALTLPKVNDESDDDYIARILRIVQVELDQITRGETEKDYDKIVEEVSK